MEGEEIVQKKDDEVCNREKAAKTYNNIVARKEMQLARAAQFDRRALFLTKHFMKESEQQKKQEAQDLREASQRSYDRSMERVHSGYASEAMLKEMVREEKNQISQLMSMRAQQRDKEEENKKEKEEQRQYYREARSIYDRMQKEERQKALDEKQKERKDTIQERLKLHDDRCKELLDKKAEDQAAMTARFEAHFDKVNEARKEHTKKQRREQYMKWKAYQEKEKAAEEARQQAVQSQQQNIRMREEERQRRVLERHQVEEEETQAKIQRILSKGPAKRSPESFKNESTIREQRQERASTSGEVKKREQEESMDQKQADGDRKDRSARQHRLAPLPTTWRDLKETNAQVHKEYVAKCADLSSAAHKMQTKNRFKALADAASELEDDWKSARLKAVHQTLVNKKPKEQNKDVPISTRGSRRPVARSARMLTCGLCEREFPPEHLVGSALRRTVERFRQQQPNAPKHKVMSAREKNETYQSHQSYQSEGRESSPDHHRGHPNAQRSGSSKSLLYDYEVKLCVNCDIFIRIAST